MNCDLSLNAIWQVSRGVLDVSLLDTRHGSCAKQEKAFLSIEHPQIKCLRAMEAPESALDDGYAVHFAAAPLACGGE
jgi:hypothetical protein